MQKPIARKHHYIPQMYLRSFSRLENRKHKVFGGAVKEFRFFSTTTEKICTVRDFNRVDIEGRRPDELEETFAKFESQAANAIRNVSSTLTFSGNDKIAILNLVALLAIRSPWNRENIRQFEERTFKIMIGAMLSSKQRWESLQTRMRSEGRASDKEVSYEELRKFYDEDEYDISVNREHHISMEFSQFDAVLPTFFRRKWRMLHIPDGRGQFITCDRPVGIICHNPEMLPALMRYSPGFGMRETTVLFSLTKFISLLGTFEAKHDDFIEADEMEIALVNSCMINNAMEQLYCSTRKFHYLTHDLQLRYDDNVMEMLKNFQTSANGET